MNELQHLIDHGATGEEITDKYAIPFDQWLLNCWGRDGKVAWIIMRKFTKLRQQYGDKAVYDMVEYCAEKNIKNYRYVEVALQKKKEQEEQKAQAKKRVLVHCNNCYESYWADQRHECAIDVFPDNPDLKVGTIDKNAGEKSNAFKEAMEKIHGELNNTQSSRRKPSDILRERFPGVWDKKEEKSK